jgi:hypothetical protein
MSTSLGTTPPQSSHRSTAWSSRSCHAPASPALSTTLRARYERARGRSKSLTVFFVSDRPLAAESSASPWRPRHAKGRAFSETLDWKAGRLNTRADRTRGHAVVTTCVTLQTTPTRRSRSSFKLEPPGMGNDAQAHHWCAVFALCVRYPRRLCRCATDHPLHAVGSLQASVAGIRAWSRWGEPQEGSLRGTAGEACAPGACSRAAPASPTLPRPCWPSAAF